MIAPSGSLASHSSMAADHDSKPSRILAVDYGRKRIGLAISDELNLTAQPLATFIRTNRQNDLRRLREMCRKHGVKHVIVGHPLHIKGTAGEMARETERFAMRLRKELGLVVELVDERLTSWEAEHLNVTGGGKRTSIDDLASAVLLRDYLSQMSEMKSDARGNRRGVAQG